MFQVYKVKKNNNKSYFLKLSEIIKLLETTLPEMKELHEVSFPKF